LGILIENVLGGVKKTKKNPPGKGGLGGGKTNDYGRGLEA
jgi:hypothetical protein